MKSLICVIISSLLMNGGAWAKHWHDDGDHWQKQGKHDHDDDRDFDGHAGRCHFQSRDVRVIREYYAPQYRRLPPGLEKKFYRTAHLPPGWERRIQPVPIVVEREIAPVPVGYRRGFIDGYIVVYSPRTQVIVDLVAVFGQR